MEGNNPIIPAEASLQIQHNTQFDLHVLRTALHVKLSKNQCSSLCWPSEYSNHAEGGCPLGTSTYTKERFPLGGCLLFSISLSVAPLVTTCLVGFHTN